jgi:hypothetical protein
LVVVLDGVQSFPGGTADLHAKFWLRFYESLKTFHEQRSFDNGFTMVLADYSGLRHDACTVTAGEDGLDCSKLIKLPPLTDFRGDDVLDWLEDLAVPEEHPTHAQWAHYALRKPSGEQDATPSRVFKRLLQQPLWPDQEDEW